MRFASAATGLWLAATLAACDAARCVRHSDCEYGDWCSPQGECELRPIDAAPSDAAADAGAPDVSDASASDGGPEFSVDSGALDGAGDAGAAPDGQMASDAGALASPLATKGPTETVQ